MYFVWSSATMVEKARHSKIFGLEYSLLPVARAKWRMT